MTATIRIEQCPSESGAQQRKNVLDAQGFALVKIVPGQVFLAHSTVDSSGTVIQDNPTTVSSAFVVIALKA